MSLQRREFVMLAHTYNPKKHKLSGSYMSEKLDGQRCIWLPFTRGMKKEDVPFANTAKDSRYVHEQICTGLWSRYGNVIHAPDYWLDDLPNTMLDGELYTEGTARQNIMSIIKKLPEKRIDIEWESVKYYVFESPNINMLFKEGRVNCPNFSKELKGVYDWAIRNGARDNTLKVVAFPQVIAELKRRLDGNKRVLVIPQTVLPQNEIEAIEVANKALQKVSLAGGEGIMCRSALSMYETKRSHSLLKLKKVDDAEGTVLGYTTGRLTDKGSKLLGLMGALILELDNGKIMELSGFTDEERKLTNITNGAWDATQWAEENPDKECPDWIEATHFPRGSRVTFKYRGTSNDGIPNEARYWRKDDRF